MLVSTLSLVGCDRVVPVPEPATGEIKPTKEAPMSDQTPLQISGDRNAPPSVPSVLRNGVRFEQNLNASEAEFGQVGGILNARDAKTKAVLWSLKIYENKRRPGLEGDVQDVFFRSMTFDPKGRLIIENENGERFAVNVDERKVTTLR